MNDSPHLPDRVRQWFGDSRAHWEGDTLVIDVTNFSPKQDFMGSRENLHLVERWTRTGPETLRYEVTIEDPTVWVQPWTVKQEFRKQSDQENRIYYEPRCHEGNYGFPALLRGARLADQRYAEGTGPHPATSDNASGSGTQPISGKPIVPIDGAGSGHRSGRGRRKRFANSVGRRGHDSSWCSEANGDIQQRNPVRPHRHRLTRRELLARASACGWLVVSGLDTRLAGHPSLRLPLVPRINGGINVHPLRRLEGPFNLPVIIPELVDLPATRGLRAWDPADSDDGGIRRVWVWKLFSRRDPVCPGGPRSRHRRGGHHREPRRRSEPAPSARQPRTTAHVAPGLRGYLEPSAASSEGVSTVSAPSPYRCSTSRPTFPRSHPASMSNASFDRCTPTSSFSAPGAHRRVGGSSGDPQRRAQSTRDVPRGARTLLRPGRVSRLRTRGDPALCRSLESSGLDHRIERGRTGATSRLGHNGVRRDL